MPGQATNRYYLQDKKDSRLLSRQRNGDGMVGRGSRRRARDWFLLLKSSVVGQNSRIPQDLFALSLTRPRNFVRARLGGTPVERAFRLKKRRPPRVCRRTELATEKPCQPPLRRAERKSKDRDAFPRKCDGEVDISMKITRRSRTRPSHDAKIMRQIRMGYALGFSPYLPARTPECREKSIPIKIIVFLHPSRTLYVPRQRREKDLCHNREKRTIRLRERERERERERKRERQRESESEDTIIERKR